MQGTKVPIKENLILQLHRLGKKEDKPLAILVDELIRDGLERREENEAAKAECPF